MNDEEDCSLEAVAAVMARLADGDTAAMLTLQDRWGPRIRAALKRIIRRRGVRLPNEVLDELVVEAVLVLHDLAPSWSPDGGAMPWVWGEPRLANVVDLYLDQLGPSFDDLAELHVAAEPAARPGTEEDDVEVVLAALAAAGSAAGAHHEVIGHLQVALRQVAVDRDRRVFLEVAIQRSSGDPSPANTVAVMYGMTPAAVRQVCCRLRKRLLAYAAEVPEQGLAELALVA